MENIPLIDIVKSRRYDIPVEHLIALMDKNGFSDNLVVCPVSKFKRPYRNDIIDVLIKKNKGGIADTDDSLGEIDWNDFYNELPAGTYIAITRSGLIDSLPESVIHRNKDIPATSDKKAALIKEEIEENRQERKAARRVFLPIEQAFFRYAIQLSRLNFGNYPLISVNAEEGIANLNFYQKAFKKFWNLPDFLSGNQINLLSKVLPLAPIIAGDIKAIEAFFSLVLNAEVKIELNEDNPYNIKVEPGQLTSRLGARAHLGVNSVLGKQFRDGTPTSRKTVKIQVENVKAFLPKQEGVKLLELLIDYFLPLELDVELKFSVMNVPEKFHIVDNKNTHNKSNKIAGYLGYTTHI